MKHIKNFFCLLFLSSLGNTVHAQSTIPAAGGNVTGTGGSVSFTVGQVVYTTISGTTGTVAQGVQQPYEISVVTAIKDPLDISLEFSVYPNPATDFIKLKIENYEAENLKYQLFDINGSLLKDNKVEGNETNIVMSNLLPATYFLKVTDNNKVVKTFKIIKH
jgi:hypothetical protein